MRTFIFRAYSSEVLNRKYFSELERKHAQLADMEKKVEIYEALIVRSSSVQLTQSLQSLTREFERHDGKKYIGISRIYEG